MRQSSLTLVLLLFSILTIAQGLKTKNIVIITLDGVRWQEIFEGADSAILYNPEYVRDKKTQETFWHSDPRERRKKLFPFFWETIGVKDSYLAIATMEVH